MEEKIKQQNIERLDINCNTIDILKETKINTLGQLIRKTRTDLKNIGLEHFEISKIEIELQLLEYNLKS